MKGEGQTALCPNSLFYELMDFTCELSNAFGLSPFVILEQEKDRVIMLLNYYIEKGQNTITNEPVKNKERKNVKENIKRIRVNDATATGGWF